MKFHKSITSQWTHKKKKKIVNIIKEWIVSPWGDIYLKCVQFKHPSKALPYHHPHSNHSPHKTSTSAAKDCFTATYTRNC